MKRFASPYLCCPICQGGAEPMLNLSFSEKKWLPDEITLAICVSCDFAFTSPADADDYVRYYTANTNDLISSNDEPPREEQLRYYKQASFLQELLDRPAPKHVLDIGCGAGGLLRTLRKQFSQHAYHGTDPNLNLDKGMDGVTLSHDWQGLPKIFDLIVLSHTLEHVVDLEEISAIKELLVPNGFLYAEVPDASRYGEFPRREYLYYIDRLHINHFTPTSLGYLLESRGMSLTWAGQHDFQYKDGELYPACCALFAESATTSKAANISASTRLADALPLYLNGEVERAKIWRQKLAGASSILVYGFGDNFFRALSPNGPLTGLLVQAIVDQRWEALRQSRYADTYQFIGLPEAVEKYAHSPIVITVSFGGEAIAQTLRKAGYQRVFIL